jgi:hypothetical protein
MIRWINFVQKENETIKKLFLQQLCSQPKVKTSLLEVAVMHYCDSTVQGNAAQPVIKDKLQMSDCVNMEQLLSIRRVPHRDEEGRTRIVYRRLQHIKTNITYGIPRAGDTRVSI